MTSDLPEASFPATVRIGDPTFPAAAAADVDGDAVVTEGDGVAPAVKPIEGGAPTEIALGWIGRASETSTSRGGSKFGGFTPGDALVFADAASEFVAGRFAALDFESVCFGLMLNSGLPSASDTRPAPINPAVTAPVNSSLNALRLRKLIAIPPRNMTSVMPDPTALRLGENRRSTGLLHSEGPSHVFNADKSRTMYSSSRRLVRV